MERRDPLDRAHGRGGSPARLLITGPDGSLAVARDCARTGPRSRRGGAGDHRRPERAVRSRRTRWDVVGRDGRSVAAEAARAATALEVNGSPLRLALSAERARRAVAGGCILTIDSDVHHTGGLDDVRWGVSRARRGWVTATDVLNTR